MMNGRADIDTSRLYTEHERAEARAIYARDVPDGPTWEAADPDVRASFLEAAGRSQLERLTIRHG